MRALALTYYDVPTRDWAIAPGFPGSATAYCTLTSYRFQVHLHAIAAARLWKVAVDCTRPGEAAQTKKART